MLKTAKTRRVAGGPLPVLATSDEELLLCYRNTGSREAFEELVRRYQRELYSYLRRYTGDAVLAEDAFQATFLQLHLKCDQFDATARLKPWLYTIATHQAIDAMRKDRRHKMVSLDRKNTSQADDAGSLLEVLEEGRETGPQPQLHAAERRQWVHQAVSELPEHLRCVVVMVYHRGLKYREVADRLSLPLGTIKSRVHTAMQKLQDAWSKSDLSRND
jgi:RNA polymerase sigma-70 factor (ECF subfamily)